MGDISPFNEDGTLKSPEQLSEERLTTIEDSDEMGPLTFSCENGHRNTRQRGKLIPNCTTCNVSVGCAPEVSSAKKRVLQAVKKAGKIAVAFWQKFGGSPESVAIKPVMVKSTIGKTVANALIQKPATTQADVALAT
jgi:hypothetical protein